MNVRRMMSAGAVVTLVASAVAVHAADESTSASMSREYVRIESGLLHGRTTGAVDQFLGVPFAAPPVGELRWRAPAPAAHWNGVRDATVAANRCIEGAQNADGYIGSEDCLYLNVYRPSRVLVGTRLPVLVFVHGGSNLKQSANDYDPSAMIEQENIIVVTVEYRLSVFGFLALPSLDTEAGDTSSGNFGLQDQQAALRWVKRNIAQFGGDQLEVTVGGESAGAIDLCANLVSPAARGLFRRAILESMYCPTATHDEALAVGAPVATALNCTDVQTAAECMRAASPAQVYAAGKPYSFEPGGGSGFNASPNFGNKLLPLQVTDAITLGQWNVSRILVGSNHDEAALFTGAILPTLGIPLPPGQAAYAALVKGKFGALAPQVMQEYPLSAYPNTFIAYSDQSTDPSPLGCETTQWSQLFAQASETFRYEFADANAPVPSALSTGDFPIGAYHGAELQYLYGTSFEPGPQADAQKALSRQMIRYWGNFVKSGNPNGAGLTHWPRYDASSVRLMRLAPGGNAVIDTFDTNHHCAFWAAHPQD